jgi:CubicO group peptidase (beta-lactamase class C family)
VKLTYFAIVIALSTQLYAGGSLSFEDHVYEEMSLQQIVGLGMAVVDENQILYSNTFGLEDKERGVIADRSDTLFRLGTMTHMVTATLALKAYEEGLISLDKNIQEYWRGYKLPKKYYRISLEREKETGELIEFHRLVPLNTGHSISMAQLLTHTSGLKGHPLDEDDYTPGLANLPFFNRGMKWGIRKWLKAPLTSLPGTKAHVTKIGYNLAGIILEKATNARYMDLVKKWINIPTGITSFTPDTYWKRYKNQRRSVWYTLNKKSQIIEAKDRDLSWALASEGLLGTINDMAKFCKAQLQSRYVSKALRNKYQWSPQRLNDDTPNMNSFGQILNLAESGVDPDIYAGSDMTGAKNILKIDPNKKRCYIIMSNTQHHKVRTTKLLELLERATPINGKNKLKFVPNI